MRDPRGRSIKRGPGTNVQRQCNTAACRYLDGRSVQDPASFMPACVIQITCAGAGLDTTPCVRQNDDRRQFPRALPVLNKSSALPFLPERIVRWLHCVLLFLFLSTSLVAQTAPAVALSSKSLTFGQQVSGTVSPVQTITVTNSGT